MGFLDKAKVAAGQAATVVQEGATKAQERMDVVQAKRGAEKAYAALGREAFRLVEAGEISNPALESSAEHVRAAEARVAEAERAQAERAAAARTSQAEPAAPPPPATPS
jgi:hypothetical protein